MDKEDVKTGEDLYQFGLRLLRQKRCAAHDADRARPRFGLFQNAAEAFPPLLIYLLSIWAVAEQHKAATKLSYALIAEILEAAFSTPAKMVDWLELEKEPWLPVCASEPNSPEYFLEIKTYQAFERQIRNAVISLWMLETYGAEKLDFIEQSGGGIYRWENRSVEPFLERGLTHLAKIEQDDANPKRYISWHGFGAIINWGRYTK